MEEDADPDSSVPMDPADQSEQSEDLTIVTDPDPPCLSDLTVVSDLPDFDPSDSSFCGLPEYIHSEAEEAIPNEVSSMVFTFTSVNNSEGSELFVFVAVKKNTDANPIRYDIA